MKQLNNTITLSFIEEDNQQRVIFRVIPLCTREGVVFRGRTTEFPDQGSLRIVPDKREQSTFKERMRTMGCLCAIQLCSEGKELAKVRQNRNYDPGQGENNQFAIYSDVICEFAEEGVFEVFNEGADHADALSTRVLLRRGKVLYGPVEKTETDDWSTLKPFGNDRYLLQTVEWPDGAERSFYWDPEQTVNWRQRRGTLRRGRQRTAQGGVEEDTSAHAAKTIEKSPQPVPDRREQREPAVNAQPEPVAQAVRAEMPEPPAPPQPAPVAEREAEAALPIGTKLNILDNNITFEEQISKLDQPLSNSANLLSKAVPAAPDESASAPPRVSGTPLTRMGVRIPMPVRRGEGFRSVVEHQIRAAQQEPDAYPSDFSHVDNPLEALSEQLDAAWRSPELQRQVLDSLCDNEAFTQSFLKHLRDRGRELQAVQAAQEQLADIEAERLSLLMQLEEMKSDDKRAREAFFAHLSQKKREELTRLEAAVQAARTERDALTDALCTLGDEARKKTLEALAETGARLCASDGESVAIAPTIGTQRAPEAMVADVRAALGRRRFACNEDDATELLLHFALDDAFTLASEMRGAAERCARTLLEGLGLTETAAFTHNGVCLRIVSLLEKNGLRTPTVEVCPPGRAGLTAFGHKTVRLLDADAQQTDVLLPLVVVPTPRADAAQAPAEAPLMPVSLQSLHALSEEGASLLPKGEEWLAGLAKALDEQGAALSDRELGDMRRFAAAASARLRGGFLAAADAAAVAWIVPVALAHALNLEALKPFVENLPRTLAALGIR